MLVLFDYFKIGIFTLHTIYFHILDCIIQDDQLNNLTFGIF